MMTFWIITYVLGFIVTALITRGMTKRYYVVESDWFARILVCCCWFIVGPVVLVCWLVYKFFMFIDNIEIKVDRKKKDGERD